MEMLAPVPSTSIIVALMIECDAPIFTWPPSAKVLMLLPASAVTLLGAVP